MCRNITPLRGLEPAATPDEIEAAARQYVRKVSGVQKPTARTEAAFEAAVLEIAAITTALLAELPPRKQPRPPSRRCGASRRPRPGPAPSPTTTRTRTHTRTEVVRSTVAGSMPAAPGG